MEHGAIENGPLACTHRVHKNRRDYEPLSDTEELDDDVFGGISKMPSGDERSDGDGSAAAAPSKPVAGKGWRNVRAVMAYYYTLRKIKRNVVYKTKFYIFVNLLYFFLVVLCK